MKIIQILNFILHQNLKLKPNFLIILSLLLIACNRKPDACIEVSSNSVWVGEQITVSDCSKRGFDNVIYFGDGSNFSNTKETSYTYYTSGVFSIQLSSFSKKSNKKDITSTIVNVSSPDKKNITGNWLLTKVENRIQLEIDPNISILNLPIEKTQTYNEQYEITEDSIFVNHFEENFHLFEFKNKYEYKNGILTINGSDFQIAKYSPTQMILKGSYYKGVELLYLTR